MRIYFRIFLFCLLFFLLGLTYPVANGQSVMNPIEILPGWKSGLAFNSNKGNWLGVSFRVKDHTVWGRVFDDAGKPETDVFQINTEGGLGNNPKITYASDLNKFLVIWVQNVTPDSPIDPGLMYGRFIGEDGKVLGNPFKVTTSRGNTGDGPTLHYDSKNKQFILSYVAGDSVKLLALDKDGRKKFEVTVGKGKEQAVAVNENSNEYCVVFSSESGTINNIAKLTAKRVDASNGNLGQEIILSAGTGGNSVHVVGNRPSIAYDSNGNKYLATWKGHIKYGPTKGLTGRFLDNCSNAPTLDQFEINYEMGGVYLVYNKQAGLFGGIGEITVGGGEQNQTVFISSTGSIFSGQRIFTDFGPTGNKTPVFGANTQTGAFTALSSQDYAKVRLISKIYAGSDIIVPPLGGAPFGQPVQPTIPTQGLPTNLGQLIQQIFTWSLSILGISIFVMFFYSGFLWLTAAGNTSRIGEARTHMTNAVFGAILLLSAYLILYTINPDFVKNTVNLPGLGTTSPPTSSNPPGTPPSPPADAATKHGNHVAEITAAKAQLAAPPQNMTWIPGTSNYECNRFEITRLAAQMIGGGAGLLSKTSGTNCQGFSVDIIAFPDGYIYDAVGGSSGDGANPMWNPVGCVTSGGGIPGTCPDRYRAP